MQAVGRVVVHDGAGVTVPEPGMAVSVDMLTEDGATHGFTLEVATDGKVSHLLQGATADSSTADYDVPESTTADPQSDLLAESDTVTDAADSSTEAEVAEVDAIWAFGDAIDNITDSYNNCGYSDTVGAKENYLATTSREASVNKSSQCTGRDGLSVWDAGDIKDTSVATTCSYTWSMPEVKNDLREADVRFNTYDKDFTNKPTSSCANRFFDVRSVGTHEAGHVFGLGHVGAGHENLTMYTDPFRCKTIARTLGKSDVLALRSVYWSVPMQASMRWSGRSAGLPPLMAAMAVAATACTTSSSSDGDSSASCAGSCTRTGRTRTSRT